MEETMRQRRKRREFPDAYKAEVVALCQKGNRPIAEVAREPSAPPLVAGLPDADGVRG
jgi:transposase-like protein